MISDLFFWIGVPLTAIVFWLLPERFRYGFLALVSFGFICLYDLFSAVCLAVFALALFISLPRIAEGSRRAVIFLGAWITGLAFYIAFFKSEPLLAIARGEAQDAGEIFIPLGASYYTFKMIHVAVDTYRRRSFDTPPDIFFTYLLLFTAFTAGPIQRLDLFRQGAAAHLTPDDVLAAFFRISAGILKTVVLVTQISELRFFLTQREQITFDMLAGAPVLAIWYVAIAAYLTAYFNLGGYTDIAIGTSRLFGIRIQENFNWPMLARNLADFWRRWHITLSTWCQNYIYITVLAWLRNPYIALFASFQCMALWHMFTLNRMAWGLHHAVGVAVFMIWSRYTRSRRIPRVLTALPAWFVTQVYVTLGFLFVYAEESNDPLLVLTVMLRAVTGASPN